MSRRNLPRTFDELAGLRARGLVRESTEEQGDNSGPIVQEREERAFAERWRLVGPDRFYTDLVSGSKASRRPQFMQMVADAKAGEFDVLLVYDTSRFARNWAEAGRFEEELKDAGVVVAYIREQQLSSSQSSVGRAVLHAVNDDWLATHRVKVRGGYRVKRFEAGKFSGSPPIGYAMEYVDVELPGSAKGWERRDTGRLLPDREPRPRVGQGDTYTNADLVERIGQLYASGSYGFRSLAVHLNRGGYRNRRGEPFAGGTIRHILESPTYAGYLSWHHRVDKRGRGEQLELVDGPHEGLWSRELWARIEAVRRRQTTGGGGQLRYPYPLRRLAVCDRCNRSMSGEAHRGVPYMACPTQRDKRHDCDQKGVKSGILEDQVGRWLATLRVPADWRAEIVRMQRGIARAADTRPVVDRSKLEAQLYRLGELYVMEGIGREEYVGRRRALEASLAGGPAQPTYSEAILARGAQLLNELGELWRHATPAERQELAGNLFQSVRIRDKQIVHATLARDEYAALVASSEAQRRVGKAPPEGIEPPTQALGRPRSIR